MTKISNPFKNRQLRNVLLSIMALGIALAAGIAVQGEEDWYWVLVWFTGFTGFVWLMAYLLRNNP